MAEPLLIARGLTKRFGALAATDALSLEVESATIHALIGPNGAGKSTTVAQLSGELKPDAGAIQFAGHDITAWPAWRRALAGLHRSYQITSLFPAFTAEDNVALAVQAAAGHSFRFFAPARRDRALRDPARALLAQVGLERPEAPVAELSHGERRQVELAMVLAGAPRMLLLDEPMAGMGQAESRRLTEILRGLKGRLTILLVEHDMDIVFALADRITVLDKGQAIATGAPHEIRESRAVRAAYLGDG